MFLFPSFEEAHSATLHEHEKEHAHGGDSHADEELHDVELDEHVGHFVVVRDGQDLQYRAD